MLGWMEARMWHWPDTLTALAVLLTAGQLGVEIVAVVRVRRRDAMIQNLLRQALPCAVERVASTQVSASMGVSPGKHVGSDTPAGSAE
jgi:hypothetical protein